MDGSSASRNAIDFAFAEAKRRGTELVAVCAWQPITAFALTMGPLPPEIFDEDPLAEAARQTVEEAIADHRKRYPEVSVSVRTVRAHPAAGLLETATPADLARRRLPRSGRIQRPTPRLGKPVGPPRGTRPGSRGPLTLSAQPARSPSGTASRAPATLGAGGAPLWTTLRRSIQA